MSLIFLLVAISLIVSNIIVTSKVVPINHAYYVRENNSFVVTCRLTKGMHRTPSTCDFLIQLQPVFQVNPDGFHLFNSEQWVLIRKNLTAIGLYTANASNPRFNNSQKVLNKILEFPRIFNQDPKCFGLRWFTHYDPKTEQLQFRILMGIEFQQTKLYRKCTLHPWKLLYPSSTSVFASSNLSFVHNYIEIRFAPNEQAIDEHRALSLRKHVQWRFVSIEMTHIYRRFSINSDVRGRTPTYYIVLDITDGECRWYVWKTSLTIQTFLNETFKSLSHQFQNFKNGPNFAQIGSILLTQRAQNAYSTTQLKEILTTADQIRSTDRGGEKRVDGRGEWTADVPVWDMDAVQVKRELSKCHVMDGSDIRVEIESFVVKHVNARVRRPPPLLPSEGFSGSTPVTPLNGPNHSPLDIASSSYDMSSDSYDAVDYEVIPRLHNICKPFSGLLQIRGGPAILFKAKREDTEDWEIGNTPRRVPRGRMYLHVNLEQTPAIFEVPQRKYTSQSARKHSPDRMNALFMDSLLEQPTIQDKPTQVSNSQSGHEDTPQNVETIYIVLYDGHDHGREAKIISFALFIVVFVLTCTGFGCIILEQAQLRRGSASSSMGSSSYNVIKRSPTKRRRKSDH
eukprot:31438_1